MKTNPLLLLSALALLIFSACSDSDAIKTSETGLQYTFHTKNEGPKPAIGDMLTLNMVYKTQNDSVLYSTFVAGKPIRTPLTEPTFKGGVEEGFAMMSIGDSATFIMSADSVFEKTFGTKLPDFIKPGSTMSFVVKLEDFKSQKQIEDDLAAEKIKNEGEEAGKIAQYLKENNITVMPTASGIYFVETTVGTGVNAVNGNTVSVHYTGKFLDGKIFDSSLKAGRPIDFKLGEKMVIEGWEEGIAMMKKGGKATIVIPSKSAYGERGAQNPQTGEFVIAPFMPLVFDVELVDITN